ncbi:MAG: hypothetical protein QOH31_4476 [Verrucomicrobiota bacterium]
MAELRPLGACFTSASVSGLSSNVENVGIELLKQKHRNRD